jgi:hypothetical protein
LRIKEVDSAFSFLKIPTDRACDFLGVFARSEYALKAAGFARGDERQAEADWDAFAQAIADDFDLSKNHNLRAAVDYLLTKPPKKQVLKNKSLQFFDAPPDKNQRRAQQVLLMVRRVRNNLFHGGKFLPVPTGDPDRDKLLIQHSLTVLRTCISLHNGVSRNYAG